MIVQRMSYALLLCAALCGAASAETAPRKMYVSALVASGVGARTARAATDALVLALLGRADERRRVLGDDDIRALYRRAETAMAAGKGADEQVREIADAVEADEIRRSPPARRACRGLFRRLRTPVPPSTRR